MLAEISVVTLGGGDSLGDEVAKVVEIADASGLAYQLHPSGLCIEGDWDAVMAVVKAGHDRLRRDASRVLWTIKIDDEGNRRDLMTRNVIDVEERLGRRADRGRSPGA